MAQSTSTILFTTALVAFSATAGAQTGQHVHGTGRLQVAIDGGRLALDFYSPLDNLVGFEHAPRTDKQKEAVRRMAERLRKPETLFAPSAQALCSVASTNLESAVLAPSLLDAAADRPGTPAGKPAADKRASPKEGSGHASLSAEFVFRCERSAELRDMEVRLFDFFPHLKRLDVQVVSGKGQKSTKLSPGNRRVAW